MQNKIKINCQGTPIRRNIHVVNHTSGKHASYSGTLSEIKVSHKIWPLFFSQLRYTYLSHMSRIMSYMLDAGVQIHSVGLGQLSHTQRYTSPLQFTFGIDEHVYKQISCHCNMWCTLTNLMITEPKGVTTYHHCRGRDRIV